MADLTRTEVTDARILAAMRASNPPIEKLMADRLALRQEMRETKAELELAQHRVKNLDQMREVLIPRSIAFAKTVTLATATLTLAALIIALFTKTFALEITATLFASHLQPLWLVDLMERKYGRWRLQLQAWPVFVPALVNRRANGTPYRRAKGTPCPDGATLMWRAS